MDPGLPRLSPSTVVSAWLLLAPRCTGQSSPLRIPACVVELEHRTTALRGRWLTLIEWCGPKPTQRLGLHFVPHMCRHSWPSWDRLQQQTLQKKKKQNAECGGVTGRWQRQCIFKEKYIFSHITVTTRNWMESCHSLIDFSAPSGFKSIHHHHEQSLSPSNAELQWRQPSL